MVRFICIMSSLRYASAVGIRPEPVESEMRQDGFVSVVSHLLSRIGSDPINYMTGIRRVAGPDVNS